MSNELIVSIASYPPRIHTSVECIKSLLAQSVKPDHVFLWLYEGEFPLREDELPKDLLELQDETFQICWAEENLKPHNKYFWTMSKYPEAIVITADDDLLYPSTMIEELVRWHEKFPEAVIANRTHLILIGDDGEIAPYDSWLSEQDAVIGQPSQALLATNGAGALFPPGIVPVNSSDSDIIKLTCLTADDLWIKLCELKAGVPVVAIGHSDLSYIPDTQDCGLWLNVNVNGGNDAVLADLQEEFNKYSNVIKNGLLESCKSIFKKYSLYRNDSRLLNGYQRRIDSLNEEIANKDIYIEEERTFYKNKIVALRKKIKNLRLKEKQANQKISTLREANAVYKERLKTPYFIRAVLSLFRKIKRKLLRK